MAELFGADQTSGCIGGIIYRAVPENEKWNFRSGFGNHRFVAETEKAEYVKTVLPWRRHDPTPEEIAVRVTRARDGAEITDAVITKCGSDVGEIVFRAEESGEYYLWYLPFTLLGEWYDPHIKYASSRDMEPGKEWLEKLERSEAVPAKVTAYESRTAFDSFYPMELRMTDREREEFFGGEKEFVTVSENRLRPVRMKKELPLIWRDRTDDRETLTEEIFDNEHYCFQIAVCAAAALEKITVRFFGPSGAELSAEDCICFNTDGVDPDGKAYKIERGAAAGEVLPLWCGVRAENFSESVIEITAVVGAENASKQTRTRIVLRKNGKTLVRNGDDELWRHSRLFWLNSDIGISDDAFAPYTPVKAERVNAPGGGFTASILGRSFAIGTDGLPSQITCYYDAAAANITPDDPFPLLASRTELCVSGRESGEKLVFSEAEIVRETEMCCTIESRGESGDFSAVSTVGYEMDGTVDFRCELTAKKDVCCLISLRIPLRKRAAEFMMGLCREGGFTPPHYEHSLASGRNGSYLWLGGQRGGLQLRILGESESFRGGPSPIWAKGIFAEDRRDGNETVLMRADNGKEGYRFAAGETRVIHLHFSVTPFHTVDYRKHWREHYYHKNSWHSSEPVPSLENAKKCGAKTVILHQGGPLNENINYPFIVADKLQKEVERAHAMGIDYKIYYTMRELSNYTAELWALRALGDEIFSVGSDFHIADYFAHGRKDDDTENPRGGPWLAEHLTDGFGPAWHQNLANGEYDCAVATNSRSRWNNYYLEGLRWLVEVVGINGLYLDGMNYDRHIMRRIRRVLVRYAGEKADIDIHNGNEHREQYGSGSSNNLYLEHFAYADALWNGEGYEYFTSVPSYYFTEVCGLPFGLCGEMLERGGDPFMGMLFGMTARCGWSQGGVSREIWDVWEDFGIEDSEMIGWWRDDCPVSAENECAQVTVFLKPDGDALICLAARWNYDREFLLSFDREKMGMTDPADYILSAPEIPRVQQAAEFPADGAIPVEANKGWIFRLKKKSSQK